MEKRTHPIFITEKDDLALLKNQQRQIWYKLVKEAGNFGSIREMIKRYQPDNKYNYENASGGTVRSTNFHKFRSGEAAPGKRILERVKKDYPRAEYWLNQPLWEVLKGPMTLNRVDDLLRLTRYDLLGSVYKTDPVTGDLTRKKIRINSLHDRLVRDGTFDALNVVLLLMAENEHFKGTYYARINKHRMSHASFFILRSICLLSLLKSFEIHQHFDFLFLAIKNRFYYYWETDPKALSEPYGFRHLPPIYNLEDANYLLELSLKTIEVLKDNLGFIIRDGRKINKLLLGLNKVDQTRLIQEIENSHITGISQSKTPVFAKIISDTLKIDV